MPFNEGETAFSIGDFPFIICHCVGVFSPYFVDGTSSSEWYFHQTKPIHENTPNIS